MLRQRQRHQVAAGGRLPPRGRQRVRVAARVDDLERDGLVTAHPPLFVLQSYALMTKVSTASKTVQALVRQRRAASANHVSVTLWNDAGFTRANVGSQMHNRPEPPQHGRRSMGAAAG